MARPRKIDSGLVKQAQLLASRTDDIQELRMAQAVLLPALGQMTLKAAAKVIGVGRATVARLQTRFRRRKGSAPPTPRRWGGRRRALMKLEEEQAFLSAWKPKAEQGQLVVVTPLQVALDRWRWKKSSDAGSRPRWCIGCWIATTGAKWPPTHDIPRPSQACKTNGKKNAAPRVGGRADCAGRARASDSADVSGRGPFWPYGPYPTLLGSGSVAPGGVQRLRARIHLRLWQRQSLAWGIGLEFE